MRIKLFIYGFLFKIMTKEQRWYTIDVSKTYQLLKYQYKYRDFIDDLKKSNVEDYYFGKDDKGNSIYKNSYKHPHTLIMGAMGSGKSISARDSIYRMMLKNPNDVFFIFDVQKMAYDFHEFSRHDNSFRITSLKSIEAWIELLYQEFELRIEQSKGNGKMKFSNVHMVFEESDFFLSQISMDTSYSIPGTTAYKISTMLNKGVKYGFFFTFISKNLGKNSFSNNVLKNINNILLFRDYNNHKMDLFNLPDNISISKLEKGQCVMVDSLMVCQFKPVQYEEYHILFKMLKKESDYNLMIFQCINKPINESFMRLSDDHDISKIFYNSNITGAVLAILYQVAKPEYKQILQNHKNWKSSAALILDAIND